MRKRKGGICRLLVAMALELSLLVTGLPLQEGSALAAGEDSAKISLGTLEAGAAAEMRGITGEETVGKGTFEEETIEEEAVSDAEVTADPETSAGEDTATLVVAIADTGINREYFNYDPRILAGLSFVTEGGDQDENGHGTLIAQVILTTLEQLEKDDPKDLSGLSAAVRILPIRVLDSEGCGTVGSVTNGITAAAATNADVISLSVSGPGKSQMLGNAINAAYDRGILTLAAAGNDRTQADGILPANIAAALTVSAYEGGQPAEYSNYGDCVDLASEGSFTWTDAGGETHTASGTSIATARVTAYALAVMYAIGQDSGRAPQRIENILKDNAEDGRIPGYGGYLYRASGEKLCLGDTDSEPADDNPEDSEPTEDEPAEDESENREIVIFDPLATDHRISEEEANLPLKVTVSNAGELKKAMAAEGVGQILLTEDVELTGEALYCYGTKTLSSATSQNPSEEVLKGSREETTESTAGGTTGETTGVSAAVSRLTVKTPIYNCGDLTVENITLINEGNSAAITNLGNLTIKSGTKVSAKNYDQTITSGTYSATKDTTGNINGVENGSYEKTVWKNGKKVKERVYVDSTLTILGGEFCDCANAGIYNWYSLTVIASEDVRIHDNSGGLDLSGNACDSGGAMNGSGGIINSGTLKMYGGRVYDNADYGLLSSGDAYLYGGEFFGNDADGIYLKGETNEIDGAISHANKRNGILISAGDFDVKNRTRIANAYVYDNGLCGLKVSNLSLLAGTQIQTSVEKLYCAGNLFGIFNDAASGSGAEESSLLLGGGETRLRIEDNWDGIYNQGKLSIAEGTLITGNTQYGIFNQSGRIYGLGGSQDVTGLVTLIGGEIRENPIGVWQNGRLFMSGDAVVDSGNPIWLCADRVIEVTEALTKENCGSIDMEDPYVSRPLIKTYADGCGEALEQFGLWDQNEGLDGTQYLPKQNADGSDFDGVGTAAGEIPSGRIRRGDVIGQTDTLILSAAYRLNFQANLSELEHLTPVYYVNGTPVAGPLIQTGYYGEPTEFSSPASASLFAEGGKPEITVAAQYTAEDGSSGAFTALEATGWELENPAEPETGWNETPSYPKDSGILLALTQNETLLAQWKLTGHFLADYRGNGSTSALLYGQESGLENYRESIAEQAEGEDGEKEYTFCTKEKLHFLRDLSTEEKYSQTGWEGFAFGEKVDVYDLLKKVLREGLLQQAGEDWLLILPAVWDRYPVITTRDICLSVEEIPAFSEERLGENVSAEDAEDGTITYGRRENHTLLPMESFSSIFDQLQTLTGGESLTVTFCAEDSASNQSYGSLTISVSEEGSSDRGTIRFIDRANYEKGDYDRDRERDGALMKASVWYQSPNREKLQNAFACLAGSEGEEAAVTQPQYVLNFDRSTILASRQFCANGNRGNHRYSGAGRTPLKCWWETFCKQQT